MEIVQLDEGRNKVKIYFYLETSSLTIKKALKWFLPKSTEKLFRNFLKRDGRVDWMYDNGALANLTKI